MKKTLSLLTTLVLALALAGIGVAYAQGSSPTSYGPLHDFIERALATKLNLSEAQVEQELAAGKTLAQIALEHGIAAADLRNFLQEVHQLALDEAMKAGVISQAQAEWMSQHAWNFGYRYGYANGTGTCLYGNGLGMGPGFWQGQSPSATPGFGYGMMRRGRR